MQDQHQQQERPEAEPNQQQRLVEGRTTQVARLWVMAPSSLCGLLFLILINERLQLRRDLPWEWVFLPLWLGDLYTLVIKLAEIIGIRESMRRNEWRDRREYKTFFKPVCGMVDTMGFFISKILLTYYLNHLSSTRMSLFVVLTPVWVSAAISTCMRCLLPMPRSTGRNTLRHRLPVLMGVLYFILGRGVQLLLLALKLEGVIQADWHTVFVPAWILILSEFLTATILCHCAPVVHATTPRAVRTKAIRLMLLAGLQLYVMALCSFLFLFWLSGRLHADDTGNKGTVTVFQILLPLIIMSVLLVFIHPTMMYYSQQYQVAFRASLVELARAAEEGHGDNGPPVSLAATSNPTYLLQMSGTLYAPIADESAVVSDAALDPEAFSMLAWDVPLANDSSSSKLDTISNPTDIELGQTSPDRVVGLLNDLTEEGTDSCIICFTRTPNAVLMDCGHGGLCIDCARAVAQRNPGLCPVCRKSIRSVLQLTGFHELADGRMLAYSKDGYEVRQGTNEGTAGDDAVWPHGQVRSREQLRPETVTRNQHDDTPDPNQQPDAT